MTRLFLFSVLILLTGCFHSDASDLSEDVHAASASTVFKEPEFLVWCPRKDPSTYSVSIQAPDGNTWESNTKSYIDKRYRMSGSSRKTTFIQPKNWYRGPGDYIVSIVIDDLSHSSTHHISGDEIFIDMISYFNEGDERIELPEFKRTYKSPGDVYISQIKYEKHEEDAGDITFLLHNESGKTIHGEVLGQLRGVVQYPTNNEWVDVYSEGVCGTGERPESLSAGSSAYFGEPPYVGFSYIKPGHYRLVLEYSYSNQQHDSSESRGDINAYRIIKYFNMDEQGNIHVL